MLKPVLMKYSLLLGYRLHHVFSNHSRFQTAPLYCIHELQIIGASIQGEQLDAPDMIKILVTKQEVDTVPSRKKKDKPLKVTGIIPSLPFTQDTMSKLAHKRLSEIYNDLMNMIRDKKIMSEILEIEVTEDNNKLFNDFCNQYRELWLCTDEQRKELYKKLWERIETVINQHSERNVSD
ncbi:hypothetical protein [Paenibacillus sp. PK3_47]|uniref:hypothetical protein n=1 Tax=Paenibacillus sp. PK3_47 TaxID=2072642 RepID=UPI00201DA0C0|nr:hypothetical protein [Paenibacillus sp. PK3_47]